MIQMVVVVSRWYIKYSKWYVSKQSGDTALWISTVDSMRLIQIKCIQHWHMKHKNKQNKSAGKIVEYIPQ